MSAVSGFLPKQEPSYSKGSHVETHETPVYGYPRGAESGTEAYFFTKRVVKKRVEI